MQFLIEHTPWVLSCITIYHSVLAGNKLRKAWAVALFNQCLWSFWVIGSGTWGFLPLNIALWIVYWRNWRLWRVPGAPSAPARGA